MRRRQFIKRGSLWLAAGVLAPTLMPRLLLAENTPPDVAYVTGQDPAASTRAAVELLGGMSTVVKPGDKVVIKPNMSFPHPPENGTNTHPLVVAAIAGMCKEAGAARVSVLDHPLSDAEKCIERSGIAEACKGIEEDMVHGLTRGSHFTETDIPQGEEMRSNDMMKEVLAADVLIAAPTAKSHSSAGVSLAIKGMMGLIKNRGIMHWRYDLDESIVDLATLLNPDLTVIDATYVLTTGGPYGPGKVLRENAIIASRDMVAADATAVASFEWYGRRFEPRQVNHVRRAAERGLGSMDLAALRTERVAL